MWTATKPAPSSAPGAIQPASAAAFTSSSSPIAGAQGFAAAAALKALVRHQLTRDLPCEQVRQRCRAQGAHDTPPEQSGAQAAGGGLQEDFYQQLRAVVAAAAPGRLLPLLQRHQQQLQQLLASSAGTSSLRILILTSSCHRYHHASGCAVQQQLLPAYPATQSCLASTHSRTCQVCWLLRKHMHLWHLPPCLVMYQVTAVLHMSKRHLGVESVQHTWCFLPDKTSTTHPHPPLPPALLLANCPLPPQGAPATPSNKPYCCKQPRWCCSAPASSPLAPQWPPAVNPGQTTAGRASPASSKCRSSSSPGVPG